MQGIRHSLLMLERTNDIHQPCQHVCCYKHTNIVMYIIYIKSRILFMYILVMVFFLDTLFALLCDFHVWRYTPPCRSVVHFLTPHTSQTFSLSPSYLPPPLYFHFHSHPLCAHHMSMGCDSLPCFEILFWHIHYYSAITFGLHGTCFSLAVYVLQHQLLYF